MDIDRRHLLKLGAFAAGAVATGESALPTRAAGAAAPIGALGLDAAHFGVRPGSPDDQSRALQAAIDAAARSRSPLASTGPAICSCRPARSSSACAARPKSP